MLAVRSAPGVERRDSDNPRSRSNSRECPLTVKLRGRPTTCHRRGWPAISTGSSRAQPPACHGPLQRWLEDAARRNLSRLRMPQASNEGIFPNLWSLPNLTRPVSALIFTPIILRAASSNGLAERPRRSARLEPRVHTLFSHPRRHYRASRTAPALVRGHIASSATVRARRGVGKLTRHIQQRPAQKAWA